MSLSAIKQNNKFCDLLEYVPDDTEGKVIHIDGCFSISELYTIVMICNQQALNSSLKLQQIKEVCDEEIRKLRLLGFIDG